MLIYLAGPMSKYENHNFPAFDLATKILTGEGHCVISPANLSRGIGETSAEGKLLNTNNKERYATAMRIDIQAILMCNALFVLDNWHESKGARLEVHIAHVLCIPVYELSSRQEITDPIVTKWGTIE